MFGQKAENTFFRKEEFFKSFAFFSVKKIYIYKRLSKNVNRGKKTEKLSKPSRYYSENKSPANLIRNIAGS